MVNAEDRGGLGAAGEPGGLGDPGAPRAQERDAPSAGPARVVARGEGAAAPGLLPAAGAPPIEWRVSDRTVAYEAAMAAMEARVEAIAAGEAGELVWLLEHPPLYTAGTSARDADLLAPDRFPVHRTGRGGEFTYHGPGQRIAYVMLDLRRRTPDVRRYVATLEEWVIRVLWRWHLRGLRRDDRVGVWIARPDKPALAPDMPAEDKIAAIGIRIRKWVTYHGIALNVEPELDHFSGIVPCGIAGYGVTSLADLGLPLSMPEVDMVLREEFEPLFGRTVGVAGN
ncbi:lipoyl(octanoyl) transferase LipB [Prosthecomicrobium hirschii]|uniref:lipoyl(octanoyl) transferase LipB n=1 Tax=Prosthecodimorpha hirschii TaxID=665126 RepID=UPI0009F8B56A|nr:lipoyl(octanoyl) transferase LipB [Prosthecomicrobium hirschii]